MPLDRTPRRTADGENDGIGDQQTPLIPPTGQGNEQVAHDTRPGISAETGTGAVFPLARYGTNEMSDAQAQTFAVRAIKTCTFWRDHAKTWFTQLEAKFRAHSVRSDDLKFCVVVDNLDKESMLEIADVIESPPASDKYQKIKETLISRLTYSDEKRWRKLLTDVELGDRKPTHLLREMRRLTNNSVDEQLLQTLWLQRMPSRVQELLSVVEGVALDKMAELADKAMERTVPTVAAVDTATPGTDPTLMSSISELTRQIQRLVADKDEGRQARSKRRGRSKSRSRTGDKSQPSKYCFYHARFGKNARNCTQPCAWVKPLAIKAADKAEN
ncbi:uncharacterized protein LOC143894258 [Temnothorax americanus]|uniref:uncharacterized protein LOC143894258 n=1 Tax=Temnothorax americanus TaxID=1964332 RepID=UPI0040680A98